MSLRRIAVLFVVAALPVLVAPGVAAAPAGISISGAEVQSEVGSSEELVVIGSGACAAVGTVVLNVRVTDLETGGGNISSISTTSCLAAGEHINWANRPITTNVRPGDRALVTVTATGAISDTDQKEVIIKQFH